MLYLSDQVWKIQRKEYTSALLDRLLCQENRGPMKEIRVAREGGTVAAPVATVEGMSCTMNFEGWESGCEACACKAVGAADLHMDFVSEATGR